MNLANYLATVSASVVLVLPVSLAQEARILGNISDGKPSKPAPPKELPEYNIKWSKVEYKHGRKVTINNIEAPVMSIKPKKVLTAEEIAQIKEEWETKIQGIKESGGFVMVSATIYDHKATHVRWWHEGVEFSCWSNVDWNHLGGFVNFEARNKRFEMMLVSGNVSVQSLEEQNQRGYEVTIPEIPKLPSLAKKGARYMVIKGDESNERAMEYIEAIHDLYAAEKHGLIAAYLEREKNHAIWREKQENLRENPPPKPDIIINYWKKKTTLDGKEVK